MTLRSERNDLGSSPSTVTNMAHKNDYKLRERAKLKLLVYGYLAIHPCVDCGEANAIVLEFDHVRGNKKSSIARMINDCKNWEDIEAEIEKCEVRCANCHRKKTFAASQYWKQLLKNTTE